MRVNTYNTNITCNHEKLEQTAEHVATYKDPEELNSCMKVLASPYLSIWSWKPPKIELLGDTDYKKEAAWTT